MSTKILTIYESILNYAGMGVDEKGRVYRQLLKTEAIKPELVTIGNEQLVYPTRAQYDDPNQTSKVYFHPFSENAFRGRSEVIDCLQEHVVSRVNYVTAVVYQYLLVLLGSPAKHASLNEYQIELLKQISDVDAKSAQHWTTKIMLPSLKNNVESPYVKVYLKHSGTWRGESYSRLGVVSFPCYTKLIADEIDGLRVKDKADFKKLFEFIFPDLQTSDSYNYGTRTRVAPYLDALMKTSGGVTSRLNEILETYKAHIPDAEALMFDMRWADYFEDLDVLRGDIEKMPDLKGNAGALTIAEKKHPSHEVAQRSPVIASVPTPAAIATPAIAQQTTYVQPQPQVQMAPAAPVVRTNAEGKISFTDIARHNPVMAMTPNPMAPQMPIVMGPYGPMYANGQPIHPGMMPNTQQQRPPPSWAMPQAQGVPMGYGQPMMQQPMMPQQFVQPQMQQPPPGYQYVQDQSGQWILVPIQPQNAQYVQPQQPMYQQPHQQPPSGWDFRNR